MDFLFALGLQASTAVTDQAELTDWEAQGRAALEARMAVEPIEGPAKNVILFIADGMDVTTSTAARILAGQQMGLAGEEHRLAFETLPFTGFSKTYNTNLQVPDSAGTATAMLSGQKTKAGVVNVDQTVARGDCAGSKDHQLPTILEVAAETERAVGIITTTRITHATPAAVYAASPDRDWERDTNIPKGATCTDIATQLIEAGAAYDIRVVLGGGRANFLPKGTPDPEYSERTGDRGDERDLTAAWQAISRRHTVVTSTEEFAASKKADRVLGLFEPSHMKYEIDREDDESGEPSIAAMTAFAIDRLDHNRQGFFLMVEGGRVDHAHHGGNANRALHDVIAFDDAVKVAMEMTDPSDTLIIVTADHGHTMSFSGYPQRGNPILGLVRSVNGLGEPDAIPVQAQDQKPYTTLGYANGPGARIVPATEKIRAGRPFINDDDVLSTDYRQQSAVPLFSETHGGQDVAIYARGPGAHYLSGVNEQTIIYYVMEEVMKR
ncbi:MAG: alkaline phosphatase [Pseudomonadota bacterium]